MSSAKFEAVPGIWADSRRAAFFAESRLVCIADLHLGYGWAHRHAGQLMPLRPDDTASRIAELCTTLQPKLLLILGDIIHRDVPHEDARREVRRLLSSIEACSEVVVVTGNHDQGLVKMLGKGKTHDVFREGHFIFAHGHQPVDVEDGKFLVIGHEHPAIHLGDGVRGARYPCFLVGPRALVLPAFSPWAAGCEVRSGSFIGQPARAAVFTHAIAVMGNRLLPVPLG